MGIIVSPDTGQTFYSGAAEYIAVAKLDANTFVVAYRDGNDSNHGKAVIGTRTGTTITISESDIAEFSTGDIDTIDVCALSPTLFVISYVNDLDVPIRSRVIAGTVSGTTITFGSPVLSQDIGKAVSTSVCKVDSTNFVAVECTNVYLLPSRICSTGVVSGTTITMGAVYTYGTSSPNIDCANLNSTDFIMAFRYYTYVYAQVGIVDTATQTITFGTVKALTGEVSFSDLSVAAFDYNHFVVFFNNTTDNYLIAGSIGNDANRTITIGTAVSDTTNITDIDICTMDSTHFLVSYKDADDSNHGKVRAGSLTGATTLAWDDEGAIAFDTDTITYTGVCNLDGEFFLIGFKED